MRIKLILDPYAGGKKGRRYLPHVRRILQKGNLLDVSVTKGRGEALLLAREAAEKDYEIIVAGSGDGTLNEIVNGVLRVRNDVPIGLIPLGIANVTALALGIPQSPIKASKIILQRKIKKIDLGKIIGPFSRYFISMVDLGFPAAVTQKVETKFKFKLLFGKLASLLYAYREFFEYKYPLLTVKINDTFYEGFIVIVSNSGLYLGKLKISPKAKIDDGYLDVYICKKKGIINIHRYLLGLLLNKIHTFSDVEIHHAKKIHIKSSKEFPGTTDGEPFGSNVVEMEIAPQILPVIVP